MTQRDLKISDFTADEISDIHHMLLRTWDAIGMDILQCQADMENSHRDHVTMSRDHVIDVVLDADHLEMYGPGRKSDRELIKRYRRLSYEDENEVARGAFSDQRYGM